MAAVELQGVSKSYDGKATVIHGIHLEIRHGEFVVFVGPSGCGKSTLLRMIAGLGATGALTTHRAGPCQRVMSPRQRYLIST